MELIDRYVYEVGRRLPKKQRSDVEAELRSLLLDTLEDRVGKNPAEADVAALLQEFGPPARTAARYAPESQYVIGPRVFEAYKLVVGIVLGAVALGIVVSLAVNLTWVHRGPQTDVFFILSQIGQALLSYISGAAGGIGFVTIIFAILERTLPQAELDSLTGKDEAWDPRTLPAAVAETERIQPVEIIVGMCFTVLALVLFNFFPQKLGIAYLTQETGWLTLPLFAPEALRAYLPLWNVAWIASLALNAYLLRQRRWQLGTRLAELALIVLGMVILAWMLAGPFLVAVESWPAVFGAATETLTSLLKLGLRWAFVVGLIASAVDLARKGYRLYRARSAARNA